MRIGLLQRERDVRMTLVILADIIAVEGDPVADISAIRCVTFAVKGERSTNNCRRFDDVRLRSNRPESDF